MTIYEKARNKLRLAMEHDLHELDSRRSEIGEKLYWDSFKEIHSKFSAQLKQVDEAERQRQAFQQAEENGVSHVRSEQKYVDMMGQLKAQKLTEIIAALAECSSSSQVDNLTLTDPFYHDKLDPIGTFERWWDEEMQSLPSYEQMYNFLRRVSINEQGFIVYDSDLPDIRLDQSCDELKVDTSTISSYSGILKSSVMKTSKQRSSERKQQEMKKMKIQSPLLANSNHIQKRMKKQRQLDKQDQRVAVLEDIIYSYDLSPDLEGLLVEHAQYVCVPCGMIRDDQYKPMLEQFLRYVTDHNKRLHVVREAISRNWRILSDGTI